MNQKVLSAAIASVIPEIIRGVQFDFFASRTITQTQFMMLLAIRSYETCTMGGLARKMKVSMPTVTGIADRLVKMGYIRRFASPKDRRQVEVSVTAKGEKFVREFQSVIAERWARVLAPFSEKEMEVFYKLILKIKSHLHEGG